MPKDEEIKKEQQDVPQEAPANDPNKPHIPDDSRDYFNALSDEYSKLLRPTILVSKLFDPISRKIWAAP